MTEAYLNRIGYALGSESCDVEQTAATGKLTSDAAVIRKAGFARHSICAESETAYDLGLKAVRDLDGTLEGTGAIIYSTCLPNNANLGDPDEFERSGDVKHLMDFPASHLQAELGLHDAAVIGLTQQACTSLLGSVRLARALIVAEEETTKVLCVTADRFPAGATYEQAYNLISDGAAACVVSTEKIGFRVVASHAVTNGALAQASDDETVGLYFNHVHSIIGETLRKAELDVDDLAWIVPQNTNRSAWTILARLLKIDEERIFLDTIGDIGHIISSDNLVNLAELDRSGRIESGDRLLLVMAGFGLNWQTLLLEKV
ncbi:MAG: hypothetical protein KY459_13460 [Acidobacteria bacterium]|nr:hypothetical protein [Acidobacteriota bacterium]